MSLPAPASADSLSIPLVDTSKLAASKSVRNFRYVYTHCQKVTASELALTDPSLVDDPPPQPSVYSSDLNIPIALCKRNQFCTNHFFKVHFL